MAKYRVRVDEDLCIGAASCVTITPQIFQMNDDNKAVVLDPSGEDTEEKYERILELDEAGYEELILSAQSCPTLAVFVYDENDNQLFPEV